MNIPLNQQPNKASLSHRGWLLIGAFVLSALVLGTLFRVTFSLQPVGIWLLWGGAILVSFAPIVGLAIWRGKPDGWHEIGLALGVWFMNFSCQLLMRKLPIFSSLEWNWTGKVFAIIASLTFIALWRGINWREAGFTGLRKGSWLPFIVLVLLWFPLSGPWAGEGPTKIETLLFDATIPGIDEEIVYRGIMLALFNRAFGTPWKVLGASIGWGWILSSVLFGLMHGIGFKDSQFIFSIAPIIVTGIGGFVMGWIRERTGSLYPAIFLHSMGEATHHVINALVNGLV
jgi:membrane protease YdiL (CAAX protease family)